MNPVQQTIEYFRSAKAEMGKVSWPTKQETIRYSSLVIGLSIGVAVFFASLDFGLTSLVDATLSARQQAAAPASDADLNLTPVVPEVTPTTAPTTAAPTDANKPAAAPAVDLKDAKPIQTPNL